LKDRLNTLKDKFGAKAEDIEQEIYNG
jgi:hypothetical protein